jgi:hypothetical protein
MNTPRERARRFVRGLGWWAAGVLIAAWLVLGGLVLIGRFTIDVAFFDGAFALAAVVALLSIYAAVRLFLHHRLHPGDRLPEIFPVPGWLATYARYLTPVGFLFGMIFGHYYWH